MSDEAILDDEHALRLVQLLAHEDGQSLPRVAKALRLGGSELQRLLAVLGDAPTLPGLALVEAREDGARTRLWLTAKGRALCGTA